MPSKNGQETSGLNDLSQSLHAEKPEKEFLEQKRTNYNKLSQFFGHLLRAWLDIIFWDNHPHGLVERTRLCSKVPDVLDLHFEILSIYSDGAVLASLTQELWTIFLHISPFSRTIEVLHSEDHQERLQIYESVNLETGIGVRPNKPLRKELNKKLELFLTKTFDLGHRFIHPQPRTDHLISRAEWRVMIKKLLKKC
ncbi:MAG: hypothetical protein ACXAB4_07425 [Candidatus Hodarchaeales archaeon]